ncbi:MAG: pyridoxamine 5'-phosphate oxidase family protein [Thermoplasmatota archaeon]
MEHLQNDALMAVLRRVPWGSLGLSKGGRALVLPIHFGFDGSAFYFQSHPGDKDSFITSTKEACLQVTEYKSRDEWQSVRAVGALEKLTLSNDLRAAQSALIDVPFPPMWGTLPGGTPNRSDEAMFYWRLHPREITGIVGSRR